MVDRSARSGSAARRSPRRHPTGGRVVEGPLRRSRALSAGWIAVLVLLAAAFAGLRGIHALADQPERSSIFTERVVVVGVTGRPELTAADRSVLSDHLSDAQVGAVSVRTRYVGDCAAAGWTTLGAGRRASVGGLCSPQVSNGAVPDWAARKAAAAARNGDAQLGTLADSVAGCVAAVGPGAALAAAKPDGTLARYSTVADFVAGGLKLSCPITLVDAGVSADHIIAEFAKNKDVTMFVIGVAGAPAGNGGVAPPGTDPAAGSTDPSLQIGYRLGTTLPGWLTSASTRRSGIVTLTDLTLTLIGFGEPTGAPPSTVDGSPIRVDAAALTVPGIAAKINSIAVLSDAAPTGYLIIGLGGAVLFVISMLGVLLNRLVITRLVWTLGSIFLASMMLNGAVPWQRSSRPALVLGLTMAGWLLVLTLTALGLGRRTRAPAAIAGAAITVAAFTVDAALGGPMQPGSMLNSRPIFGLRWYGFGNVTFAAYASAGLILAGYLAHRFLLAARRLAAVIAVTAIGLGIVICEGWPTMGADFGGVIALTPGVVLLILAVSGRGTEPGKQSLPRKPGPPTRSVPQRGVRGVVPPDGHGVEPGTRQLARKPGPATRSVPRRGVRGVVSPGRPGGTPLRALLAAGAAVVAVGLISYLDWARGPDQRSHLGNFVQRILDGDALEVISRKAVAAAHTIVSPLGIACVLIGIPIWLLVFRYVVPVVSAEFRTLRSTLLAVLVTAVLGTLLNDGGISVWLTATAEVMAMMAWFSVDRAIREGWTMREFVAARR